MSDPISESPFGATADLTALSATITEPLEASSLLAPLAAGAQIAGYQLESEIGKGAYGTVWAAHKTSNRQRVALKVLHAGVGQGLQREVQRILELSEHPFVVPLLDAQIKAQPPYLVTARMQGSLGSFMRQVGRPDAIEPSLVKVWMRQVATALLVMHQSQIVHCDLKPDNILLDDQGNCRVCDFGQAALLSQTGTSLGTYFFMAPGQSEAALKGGGEVDARWDIYSFGATFYYLASGELPRCDDNLRHILGAENDSRVRLKHYATRLRDNPLRPLAQIGCRLEYPLQEIIERCLMLQGGYSTVQQVLDDLNSEPSGSHRRRVSPSFALRHLSEKISRWPMAKVLAGQHLQASEVSSIVAWILAFFILLVFGLKH